VFILRYSVQYASKRCQLISFVQREIFLASESSKVFFVLLILGYIAG